MDRTTQIALAKWANLYSQNKFLANAFKQENAYQRQRETRPREVVITVKYENKVVEMLPPIDLNVLSKELVVLPRKDAQEKSLLDKIVINTLDSIYIMMVSDIIYCESDKGYTTFYLASGEEVIASKRLSKYESILPSTSFMRVHQSYLVNLNHIVRYDKRDKNCLITTNHYEVPVSQRLKSKLVTYFEGLG